MSDSTPSVDDEIYSCLNLDNPRSFFLYAGAGSGKTRSLVTVLKRFREKNVEHLRRNNQKVAVITYTNAACDEIKRRLDFDASFIISTIHSFAWELIKPHQNDIKLWLEGNIKNEIYELEEKQKNGRAGSKAFQDRPNKIASKKQRLHALKLVKKIIYNPNGDNTSKDSLNHAEVISLAANLLNNKALMRKILVRKFPVLLIDESQDTKKELIEAFFIVQSQYKDSFILGLFGDTMQRIYADGKVGLDKCIPDDWNKPEKTVNYRCPKRVITLINKIRSGIDSHVQKSKESNEEGVVRLFISDTNNALDKSELEHGISVKMAEITGDDNWKEWKSAVKVLTLEHHMAAIRGGFDNFFAPLYVVDKLKTGLLDGTIAGISLFSKQILPLIKAKRCNDQFSVSRVVQKYSPLLNKETLKNSATPRVEMLKANDAVNALYSLWYDGHDPLLSDILQNVYKSGLFTIPDIFASVVARLDIQHEISDDIEDSSAIDRDKVIDAWDQALKSSFNQFEEYLDYISDDSTFGTHQGIKGLEFPRVMVILDDYQARGNFFSYEKLFGAKTLTATDQNNQADGKETSIDRTRRLFYVTCSRAEKSLAIVAYTKQPEKVKEYVINQGWFEKNEIQCHCSSRLNDIS